MGDARSWRGRTIALIGGTGLARGLEGVLDNPRIHRDVEVVWGEARGKVLYYSEVFYGELRALLLPRHGPTLALPDRSPAELIQHQGHESHVWLLHEQGVDAVYAFSAVGALDLDTPLADQNAFVVPDRFGRGLGATVHSFGKLARDVHPNMASPFDPRLRRQLVTAIERAGARAVDEGLYIQSGPDAFETTPEIRALDRLYAGEPHRLVGMTVGPELALCRQMELPYAVVCPVANRAQGIAPEAVTHHLVLKTLRAASPRLLEVARRIIVSAAED